jgi:cytochrome P450
VTAAESSRVFGPGFFDDPYPAYRAERERAPVQQTAFGPWLLLRYADVVRVLRHPAVSVVDGEPDEAVLQRIEAIVGRRPGPRARSLLGLDPPDHTRIRRLVQHAFTPKVIESLRPLVQALVDETLDRLAPAASIDLIAELAFPLPFTVISRMLGIPEENAGPLREWSHAITKTLDPILSDDDIRAVFHATELMDDYLSHVIAAKRTTPCDDLLSALIRAEDEGDMLSEGELLSTVVLLFVAGHETTVNLIGNGTLALLRNRTQLERLRRDPSLDANAIDELLRFDSPVQFSGRTLLEDMHFDGQTLPAGTMVLTCLGSANRDPSKWGPDADELELTRHGAGAHVSFGGGVHHCLGATLARVEGQIAVPALVRRFPNIDLADDPPTRNGRIVLRGLDALPLTLQ